MAYFNCIGLAPGAINNVTSPRSFFGAEAMTWRRIGIRLSIFLGLVGAEEGYVADGEGG